MDLIIFNEWGFDSKMFLTFFLLMLLITILSFLQSPDLTSMSMKKMTVFHTQAATLTAPRTFPKLAEGYEEWLGDGYYFWQDEYFAKWWGQNRKCKGNITRRYTIFTSILEFNEDEFVDTVFNEEDYYQFVAQIERFATKHQKNLGRKPTLREFNQFISDFQLWENIKVIRFQDLPQTNEHIEVLEFYYKKRIQIRVNDPEVIKSFAVHKTLACI